MSVREELLEGINNKGRKVAIAVGIQSQPLQNYTPSDNFRPKADPYWRSANTISGRVQKEVMVVLGVLDASGFLHAVCREEYLGDGTRFDRRHRWPRALIRNPVPSGRRKTSGLVELGRTSAISINTGRRLVGIASGVLHLAPWRSGRSDGLISCSSGFRWRQAGSPSSHHFRDWVAGSSPNHSWVKVVRPRR